MTSMFVNKKHRYFSEGNSRKNNGYLYNLLLPWQQSEIDSYERKRNPRRVANLFSECQELKLKGKLILRFFKVLHPSTVTTVGSHLK